ncbi:MULTISPECIES: hypothetical protein [Methylomonas]|uniref:hypothetical protein n=1 Tax=Methylomonas TaxID=416 RepID=UPI001232289D|nr:hypothetical protein [Methylomonas rhizoryzae]
MREKIVNRLIQSAAILCSLVFVNTAQAHIYSGIIVNKTTQVLKLTCPTGTTYVKAQVADLAINTGMMGLTVFKDGNAQHITDTVQTDAVYSAFATLSAGSGNYYLIATQTAAATGSYRIQYHCYNASNTETTTTNATLTQP